MPDPKKARIGVDLETSLADILIASGYHTDAGTRVDRRLENIETVDSANLPKLYIFTGSENQPSQSIGPGCYRTEAEFVITGYVEESLDLDNAVIRLEADIKKAVLTDTLRSTLAKGTTLLGTSTDYMYYADIGRGVTIVRLGIDYEWSLTDL